MRMEQCLKCDNFTMIEKAHGMFKSRKFPYCFSYGLHLDHAEVADPTTDNCIRFHNLEGETGIKG